MVGKILEKIEKQNHIKIIVLRSKKIRNSLHTICENPVDLLMNSNFLAVFTAGREGITANSVQYLKFPVAISNNNNNVTSYSGIKSCSESCMSELTE